MKHPGLDTPSGTVIVYSLTGVCVTVIGATEAGGLEVQLDAKRDSRGTLLGPTFERWEIAA